MKMIMSFIPILSIIGIAWWFKKKFHTLGNFDLLFSISLSVSIFYLFGIFNFIYLSYFLILFVGIFLFFIFLFTEKNNFYFKRYFYFIFLCVICFFYSKFTQFYLWDEFFWAQYTKSIFVEKKIYDSFSILQNHPRYTPGLPIYQNYFNITQKKFNDGNLIFANLVLIASYCLIFFENETFSKTKSFIKKNIIVLCPIILLFYIFSFGYLYVEFYISIFLSAILIYIYKNFIKFDNFFLIIPFIIFFLLIKETTIIFLPLIIFYLILINYQNSRIIICTSLLIATSLLTKISWYYYVLIGGSTNSSNSFLISSIDKFFSTLIIMLPKYSNTISNVILDYGHFTSITRKLGLPDFTTLVWILISMILIIFNVVSLKKDKKILKLIISIYFFSIFYYMFAFFIDFAFWGGDPVHFNRLSSSIIVTILLIIFFSFYNFIFVDRYIKIISSLIIIIIAFLSFNLDYIKKNYKNYLSKQKNLENKIEQIRNDAIKINNVVSNKSKIYFIHQKSSGFERTVFNYFVHPNEVNSSSWSIGEPYNKIDKNFEDIWTSNLSNEEFIDKLKYDIPYKNKYRNCCENIKSKKYDYIFINNKDEKLWKNISFLFFNADDFNNHKFFKITFDNKFPKLKPIF